MLNRTDIGSENWWQEVSQKGTPFVDAHDDDNLQIVTFLWQDKLGDENHSTIARVYIDVNSITDNQSFEPQSLKRLPGTDVWFWQMTIEKNWRGSYRLIPVTHEKLPNLSATETKHQREQQRFWWQSLQPWAVTDPLNKSGNGQFLWEKHYSSVHLPFAPEQQGWSSLDLSACHTTVFRWHSNILGNNRNIWIYAPTSGDTPATERPVVLILDGEFWARSMPMFSMLSNNTRDGLFDDAVYVLIDAIDGHHRAAEQACNQQFWQAIRYELMPHIPAKVAGFRAPSKTIVAGQSLGALSALYAGLNHSMAFNQVICQSGAFWWPHMSLLQQSPADEELTGLLVKQIQSGRFNGNKVEVFQQFGSKEVGVSRVNQQLNTALINAGIEVTSEQYNGGHDRLCWRGGLVDGLKHFLAPGKSHVVNEPQLKAV